MDSEQFSNPLAPVGNAARHKQSEETDRQPLTNSDFRKLMMTPRVLGHSSSTSTPGSVRGSIRSKHFKQPLPKSDANELHEKKKKFYETYRKHEDDVLSELNKKYRDRAKERRENKETFDDGMANSAYHSVAPVNVEIDSETRRKQMIEESKYLGGDMEHTHLVKGLDYVLLEKIKDEIQSKEEEAEHQRQLEEDLAKKEKEEQKKSQAGLGKLNGISFDDQDRYAVKSKFAENILKVVHKNTGIEKNELFAQGRLSYQYDLADFSESDIPTSIIMSKAEMMNNESFNTLSTNKIVIDKLIQILYNLRTESTSNKSSKSKSIQLKQVEEKRASKAKKAIEDDEDNIYDDVGDYNPVASKRSDQEHKSSSSSSSKVSSKHSYFPQEKAESSASKRSDERLALEMAASVIGSMAAQSDNLVPIRRRTKTMHTETDSYAECYPGAPENDDALGDSDEEMQAKSSKKKSIASRWDKESAADTKDGKKDKKEAKVKLERDLQRINSILAKRKESGQDIGIDHVQHSKRSRK